ncbi:MAG: hypothetical protein EOO06_00425 [Chitinophagaceae bacterium]|nr:MAG: hypothetical protein EOO06_00425 [Chitinophagaceae bacterium]
MGTVVSYIDLIKPLNLSDNDVDKDIIEFRKLQDQFSRFIKENNLLDTLTELDQKAKRMADLKNKILPPVYNSVKVERNGDKSITSRLNYTGKDGKKTVLAVYVGKLDEFEGKDDPIATEIGQRKMREKLKGIG